METRGSSKFVVGVVIVCVIIGSVLNGIFKARNDAAQREREAELQREREENRLEAAVVFKEPIVPSPVEAKHFIRVLTQFSDAIRDENGGAIAELFNAERMFDELLRQSGPNPTLPANAQSRSQFAAGFRKGAGNAIINPMFQWDTTTVRRIRWSADQNAAVVIASHRREFQFLGQDTSIILKVRWWFVRQSGEWKIYDFEDLDGGIRITSVMASLLSPEYLPILPQLKETVGAIRDAQVALLKPDLVAFDAALARSRSTKLPPAIDAAVHLLEAVGHMLRANVDAALASLERAERLNPDMPVRHSIRAGCYNQLGEYEKALASAEAYINQLGPDAEIDRERGQALEGLERWDEAAAAYRRALGDVPDAREAFEGLLRVLPEGDKSQLGDLLVKTHDPSKTFDKWTGLARDAGDLVAVKALERGLRGILPNDPRLSKPTRLKD